MAERDQHVALKKQTLSFPEEPGVYLMKDAQGLIIYIGKAASLKKRVTSYFQKKDHEPKTRVLVSQIKDIEYIVTGTEIEALLLESNLIKKHKPKFNIRLKDDKRYPYIAVTLNEEYPRVIYTRQMNRKGYRYFGPYTDASAAKNSVELINRTFKLKTCRRPLPLRKGERPCLNYQMKRCHGPCVGDISQQEYRELIDDAISFLEGNVEPVLRGLQERMDRYSKETRYEEAARIRDIIYDIQAISEKQHVSVPVGSDHDYVGLRIEGDEALAVLFEFRRGVLLGRKVSVFDNARYSTAGELLQRFCVEQYKEGELPHLIISDSSVEDKALLEDHLKSMAGHRVLITRPRHQQDRSVLSMIMKNIDLLMSERHADETKDNERPLEELAALLNLEETPVTLECFDISNTQGTRAVASMVRFVDGVPDKAGYRRYKIRGYDEANDPGMIHEAVARRLQYLINEDLPLPDVMVIDGGPTQLRRAMEAAEALDAHLPIISLAKRYEEIYFNPEENPVQVNERSAARRMLQRLRDEAHRFAITYHRSLRDKDLTRTSLDEIPGIGEKTRQLLLKEMKSVRRIEEASMEELKAVPGIGTKTAQTIADFYNKGK